MNILQQEERRLIFMIRLLPIIKKLKLPFRASYIVIMFFINTHYYLEGVKTAMDLMNF